MNVETAVLVINNIMLLLMQKVCRTNSSVPVYLPVGHDGRDHASDAIFKVTKFQSNLETQQNFVSRTAREDINGHRESGNSFSFPRNS